MVRIVDGCESCGLLPCYHCTDLELTCDICENETDTLYWLDKQHACEECYIKHCLEVADEVDYNAEAE